MHITHQQYLITSLWQSVDAINRALAEQHEEGDAAPPTLVAERKAAILEHLNNAHRYLDEVEPVLREQNK